jgi:lysophospholipase L1-like esterase
MLPPSTIRQTLESKRAETPFRPFRPFSLFIPNPTQSDQIQLKNETLFKKIRNTAHVSPNSKARIHPRPPNNARLRLTCPCFSRYNLTMKLRTLTPGLAGWLFSMVLALNGLPLQAALEYEPKPADPWFAKFNPIKAPAVGPLLLQPGDRLAIIGDSITEQRMYSRIIETYLTACVPELKITVRQLGWSGETAEGFRKRMESDCLRFQPTVATLCYGMNDCRYRPFDVVNGLWYRENYDAIVQGLKTAGARVVLGSPGCTGMRAHWSKTPATTLDEQNENLCALRDIDVLLAQQEQVRFADVFWTMFKADDKAQNKYAKTNQPYQLCGKDGVHPNWSGHLVMAYAFLHAMGLDGNIGTVNVDLAANTATATAGHTIESFTNNEVTVTSTKYPFCAEGDPTSDKTIRSGATLVPFFQELSRFQLVVKNATAANYQVIWGVSTNTYVAAQLAAGVNLAQDFAVNPFSEPFKKVDEAVAAKQAYETRQIKQIFHGPEGTADMNKAVADTEAVRAPLEAAIGAAMVPVTHTIRIVAVE